MAVYTRSQVGGLTRAEKGTIVPWNVAPSVTPAFALSQALRLEANAKVVAGQGLPASRVTALRQLDTARMWREVAGHLAAGGSSGNLYITRTQNIDPIAGVGRTESGTVIPAPPHPQGPDQSIGPNLGGEDGVIRPGDVMEGTTMGGSSSGFLVLGALGLLFVLLMKKK